MADRKEQFAPIPMRAMGDERLKNSHWKLLMAIAAHDRMSKNGQGCWAGHKRLADITGIHLKSVSRTLNALAEWGYIEGQTHPLNKRTRVYRVIYTDADGAVFGMSKQEKTDETGNTEVTYTEPIGNTWATAKTEILGDENSELADIIDVIPRPDLPSCKPNIFCETGIDSVETEIDCTEVRAHRTKRNNAITPLSTGENNQVELNAQARLAGKFGSGSEGWSVLLGISDQTRDKLIEKELSCTLTSSDIILAMNEAANQQEWCGHG